MKRMRSLLKKKSFFFFFLTTFQRHSTTNYFFLAKLEKNKMTSLINYFVFGFFRDRLFENQDIFIKFVRKFPCF